MVPGAPLICAPPTHCQPTSVHAMIDQCKSAAREQTTGAPPRAPTAAAAAALVANRFCQPQHRNHRQQTRQVPAPSPPSPPPPPPPPPPPSPQHAPETQQTLTMPQGEGGGATRGAGALHNRSATTPPCTARTSSPSCHSQTNSKKCRSGTRARQWSAADAGMGGAVPEVRCESGCRQTNQCRSHTAKTATRSSWPPPFFQIRTC